MTIFRTFRTLWIGIWKDSGHAADLAPAGALSNPLHLMTLAELERVLDRWTSHWAQGAGGQPDEQMAAMSRRAETELRRIFGTDALVLVQACVGQPGKVPLLLAADRLFVNFLGRRAAMAVTRKLNSVGSAITAAPTMVRRLWAALGLLIVVGMAAYAHFLLTGSYDFLVIFFRNAGSAFFVLIAATEVYFAHRARSQFEFNEPMHTVWMLVFLGACCRLMGAAFGQVLSTEIPWNPLVLFKVFDLDKSGAWHDAGLVIGGPVAMGFLATGLMCAISLTRRLGVLSRLTVGDWTLIGVISAFTVRELFEIGVAVFASGERPSLTKALLWFSDPLLTLLLMQAVAIRRSVLNMGQGLVARCWGMMAIGVVFTSAGDIALWAESHCFIPTTLSPLGGIL